jgi:hypothetical protein
MVYYAAKRATLDKKIWYIKKIVKPKLNALVGFYDT